MQKMLSVFPLAQCGEDNDGQLVIYTGLKATCGDVSEMKDDDPVIASRPASGRGDFGENMAWITRYRAEYKGRWVALRDGNLLADAKLRADLHAELRKRGVEDGALIMKVE